MLCPQSALIVAALRGVNLGRFQSRRKNFGVVILGSIRVRTGGKKETSASAPSLTTCIGLVIRKKGFSKARSVN